MDQNSSLNDQYIKGRGAQINTPNPFDNHHHTVSGQVWYDDDEMDALRKTNYIATHPKSIINDVDSPDLSFQHSANPYQGCEHGCIYCYARNTHTYWGYSAGIEFEQKILVKKNAPELLQKKLSSKNWKASPIMLSGNTDCYQPAEKEYRLTRQMLEILWRYRHPVSIITKSALILRDQDLLSQLAKENLVRIAISITTLQEELRLKLEPRTATGQKRIDIIQKLSEAGIPVHTIFAPIIPSLNDHEIHHIAKLAAEAGARSLGYTMVRLNGDVGEIFKDWLKKNFPDRYDRVMHHISDLHGGQINDSRYGQRMKGEGRLSDIIHQQIKLYRQQYFGDREIPPFNLQSYAQIKDPQLRLF